MTIFAPSEPDAGEPTLTIAQAISDDRTAHVFFTYLGEIGAVVFLLFVAALWSILRRAESEAGASTVALMGGLGFSVIEIGRPRIAACSRPLSAASTRARNAPC